MNKKIISLFILIFVTFNIFAGVLSRNETVYVKLDAYGHPELKEVVTYLKTDGHGAVDFTDIRNPKNITGMEQPVAGDLGKLTFNTYSEDIFYKGYSDKKLPVSIALKYFLNDEEISFDQINGKSGKFRIEVKFTNHLSQKVPVRYEEVGTGEITTFYTEVYIPFLTMASTSLDVTQFRNISAPEGTAAVIGNNMKINWLTQPLPSASFFIEAESNNIVIPSITFEVVPKMIPLPSIDLYDSLNKIYNGVDSVGNFLLELEHGAIKLENGQKELTIGLGKIDKGTALLGKATSSQRKMIQGAYTIESGIRNGIQDKLWMEKMSQLDQYLLVSNLILDMVINGGPIPTEVEEFFKSKGKILPKIESFPSLADSKNGLANINLGVVKAEDGSIELQEGVSLLKSSLTRLKAEGTEELKNGIIEGSSELLKKLATIDEGKKLAEEYNSFCSYKGKIESSVQFIYKSPGAFSM